MSARTDVVCEPCGTRTERLLSDAPWPCPNCGAEGRRVWGGGAFILRGGGWAGRGHTMVELAVVLIIVSLIAAAVIGVSQQLVDNASEYTPAIPAEFLDPDGELPGVCGP